MYCEVMLLCKLFWTKHASKWLISCMCSETYICIIYNAIFHILTYLVTNVSNICFEIDKKAI